MGGRGASSGCSVDKNGNPRNTYGSQYKTIFQDGNIKFVKKNQRTSETLMETVTPGRVYVTIGGNDLLQVIYFDKQKRRNKVIDLNHPHGGEQPHVHHGYTHNENDPPKGATRLTAKEKRMIARVRNLWYTYNSK